MKMKDRRTALITGASRGIGRAIALDLARSGCDIIINYLPDAGGKNLRDARDVKREVDRLGRTGITLGADVSRQDEVARMGDGIESQGRIIDILVNNAGILADTTLEKMEREKWDRVLSVNLGSAYNCCHRFIGQMIGQNYGRIINISSVVALTGNFGQTNYAASKAGLLGFTKSLAQEIAVRGITVNAVAPGIIDTDMMQSVPEKYRSKLIEKIPVGKMGTPADVANAVTFLTAERAAYITGQVIHVNGGFYM